MTTRLPRVSRVCAAGAIALGVLTVGGWLAGAAGLTRFAGGIAMKFNAGLTAILAGGALWALSMPAAPVWRRRTGQVLAALMALLAGITLIEHLAGADLGIDQLFLAAPAEPPGGLPPGRMAPNTAFGFLCVAIALLAIDLRPRAGGRPSDWLALAAFVIGLLATTDHLYGELGNTREIYRQMSLSASLSLMLLSTGLWLARPQDGLMAVVTENSVGGALVRALLPAVLLAPLALGWFRVRGERAGLYDSEFGAAILVTSTVLLLGGLVLWTARSLSRGDQARRTLAAERARIEDQLRRANTLLDAIVENIPLMVFMKDAEQLRFVRFNRTGEQLLGLSRADLLGKNDFDMFPAEQAEHFQAKDRQTLAGSGVVDIDEPIDSPSGRLWLHTKKVPVMGIDGKPVFLLGISEDITARRKQDEELRRWAHIFDHAHWGIALVSADGVTLERMNGAFAQMHGYTVAELNGRPVTELAAPGEEAIARRHVELAGLHDEHTFQMNRRRKDGTVFPALVNVSTIRDADGRPLYRAANVQDITTIKQTEAELRRAMAVAEANSRELESFSYSVSHDLRSPLRSIDGFSQALLEDHAHQLDPEAREHLGRVRGAAQRMAELIDDLLELSRVTRAELTRQSIDLSALARDVAEHLTVTDPDRVVRFEIATGLSIQGDPRLVRVLLENLLGNAWKFTARRPSATIAVGRGDATAEHPSHFFVRDDGAGFDMAYIGKLFGAFQRLHRETEFEGTGIGLATVHRIVTRHGGRIWAEGAVDRGATFRFTLWPEV
jgi:PAS domain S-box-containing protein